MDVPLTSAAAPKPAASSTLSQRADQVWTRDEWILALSLYLDRRDGKVTDLDQAYRELGGRLGRSPNSIPVRLFDFEAQDPASAGKKPMAAPGAVAKAVWAEFASDPDRARAEAILARERLAQVGIDGKPQPRIWKISPGEGAEFWEDCRREGYMVVGWNELGDLSRFVGGNWDEFIAEYRKAYPDSKERSIAVQSGMLWAFLNEVKPGDIVVANRGKSVVVGRGEVLGPYQYRPERSEYRHVLPVRWFDLEERVVGDQGGGWMTTLNAIPEAKYSALLNGPAAAAKPGVTKGSAPAPGLVAAVQGSLDKGGLHFAQELISAYLLALQAKRFVILTGISGTGKTQLALAVAKAFPVTSRRATPAKSADSYGMTVRPYMHNHAQLVLPTSLAARITRPADFESYALDLEYPGGVIKATLGNLKPDRIPDLYFRRPFTTWFAENMPLGTQFELVPTLSESGDLERLTLRLAITEEVASLQNHAVVEVRPDWTDSRGLLGYWNPITERYHAPPFLRLLLEACEEEERAEAEGRTPAPFFVVLDEMNLARVEHYFAELLSCLESDEPLKLHDDARIESGLAADGELPIPRELKVPGNLFITGTVNIDETTHMFSPKVLDRAFVLELNDVDLGFLDAGASGGLRLTEAPEVLQRDGRNREAWDGFGELAAGGARESLLALHRALEVHGRHFAYRVAFDVARFVVLADEQGEGTDAAVWAALDEAVLAKVLPKLAGTQAELESLLGELLAICTGTGPEPLLPKSARKLARMRSRLSQVGYCSFIG